jgi:hypothetical protein
LLRDQGMPLNKLSIIYKALIVSRIAYAVPAWGGFASVELVGRVNSLLRRVKRYQLTDEENTFEDILYHADHALFKNMQNASHCTFNLLPPFKVQTQSLRCKGHNFILPSCRYNLHKNSFVPRCLFEFL